MRGCLALLAGLLALPALAAVPGLPDAPRRIADGVWVFEGAREHFTRDNGGNIVNTGFIETDAGVVVIDPGPSLRYGQAQREAIRKATGKDVVRVYVTHAHPDHFLGAIAYDGVPVLALEKTAAAIRDDGEELAANLYLLVGGAMAGTRPVPVQAIDRVGEAVVGGRRLRLLALDGHTDADLALLDERSGVLFAGDLAFLDRAPTTPNADIDHWLAALDALQKLRFTMLVPGHGPIVNGPQAIAQTRDYLAWARQSLQASAARGLDMNEAMREPLPERFRAMGVAEEEWRRTVSHLYPDIELEALPVR